MAHFGYKQTPEHTEKIRRANTGKKRSFEACLKISRGKLGVKASDSHKRHVSEAQKGVPKPTRSELHRKRLSESSKKRFLEGRSPIGKMGSENHSWVGDRENLKRYGQPNRDRRSAAYRDWRIRVWRRDNFRCKIGNSDCEGRIEAHHILSYSKHPELRYDINNGITLCKFHHPRKRVLESEMIEHFRNLISGGYF